MRYLFCFVALLGIIGSYGQSATTIQTNAPKDLIPEGIAIDERTSTIYVSSINQHSIIAFGNDGKVHHFVQPDQDGFLEGLGMKIDKASNRLWALSNKRDSNQFTSRIHAFDLTSGKTVFQYTQTDTIPHLFNDLVLAPDGTIYFTDTYYSAVYQLKPNAKAPEVVIKSSSLDYPNGLVFGKGSQLLIATYRNGLMQLDPASKTLKPLTGAKDSTLSYG
ncbi:MAG TPA: hypothetical protein VD794_02510, partial [Flavisolibacter sp.]|nr:hypothetical protein [Flavisolibacter sp.]